MGTFLGSHAPPRRPPERQGVPFGRILGSFWGHFLDTFGAKMTSETVPKKLRFLRTDFGSCWWFWWLNFGSFLAVFCVWRRLSTKKANMCFLSIVLCFRRIFRVRRGQKIEQLDQKCRRSTCRFSDDVLGHIFVRFGSHFGALLDAFRFPRLHKKRAENEASKMMRKKAGPAGI